MKQARRDGREERDSGVIRLLQFLLPLSFTTAIVAIIMWIVSLIRLSAKLHDVPSASVGISIVAIPLFLLLLGIFWYVFLGIFRNREEPEGPGKPEGGRESE